ncbi:MAG: FAD-binding and (Fe-S)-binding domain-containing protein [Aggregatilineales bacterium]
MAQHAIHDVVNDLEKAIGSEQVKFDQMSRLLYSTDASNYQIMPIGVTFPRNTDDVIAIHEIADQYRLPLLPRGAGSSLAGQTVNEAIVMDFSRHMRRVRGINAEEQSVVVEAGMVLGQLNQQLQSLGLMFGPDPASADRATIGGCIGNNASGSHSIVYGMTADHVKRLEVILASGEKVWLDAQTDVLQQARALISGLVTENHDEIIRRFPKTFRTVAGYALNKIDPDDVNLNWLFTGSEGTLGTLVAAELNLVKYHNAGERRLAMVHFDSLRASLEATPRILELNPSAIELMDAFLLNKTRQSAEYSRYMDFIDGYPEAVLVVEFYGENDKELSGKIDTLRDFLNRSEHKCSMTIASTPQQQLNVWKVRKAGLGLLLSQRGDSKPIAFVEDAAVPVEQLADYIDDVARVVEREGTTFAVYAHASAGCLHVRPLINLKTIKGRQQYRNIAEALTDAAIKYGGTVTGEHGQGIVRGEFTEKLFGAKLTDAFRQIKATFDPKNRMNPGKIIDVPPMDEMSVLRYTPEYEVIPLHTRFDWSEDGGLSGAAEMCNGAGVCRKEGSGTMCPSYMATRDEQHATRGRANALRLAMSGKLPQGLGNKELKPIFDLCLSCKACAAECPSSVDVARMKAEYLAASYDANGTPLTARIFGNIHRINQLTSLFPKFSNFMMSHPIGLAGAGMLGLPTNRPLPKLAEKRFSKLVECSHHKSVETTLIIDTFTEFNHPEVGLALVKVAEVAGLKLNIMRLPEQGCCGRPAISKGLLDSAKKMANSNVLYISEHIPSGALLFLEPSCQSAFLDDYPALVDEVLQDAAQQIAERAMSAEAWLAQALAGKALDWDSQPRQILLHGHCHQKALWNTDDTLKLLRMMPESTVKEIDSGCCGVAGSFGYEHYDLSMKIANQRLLPAIEANPGALVVAPGTSCRTQIFEAGHKVWHPIEIIAESLGG